MFFLVFASAISVALGQIPNWYNGACGQSKYSDAGDMNLPAKMIVGGQEAKEHEFPWQVSLIASNDGSHFCGGSIINENWVVTASHCVSGETTNSFRVVSGLHDRTAPSADTVEHTVSQIIMHPDYAPVRIQNDVALVQVSTPFSFNQNVAPVCPPDGSNLYTHRKAVVSGWGTLQSGGLILPAILRYVTVNITTNQFCDTVYDRDDITDDMVCASDNNGGNDRDSCQGDSGGPMTVKESDGTFRLVGCVSWGIGCASGYPGVYCRVPYFNDWITSNIGA